MPFKRKINNDARFNFYSISFHLAHSLTHSCQSLFNFIKLLLICMSKNAFILYWPHWIATDSLSLFLSVDWYWLNSAVKCIEIAIYKSLNEYQIECIFHINSQFPYRLHSFNSGFYVKEIILLLIYQQFPIRWISFHSNSWYINMYTHNFWPYTKTMIMTMMMIMNVDGL